MRGLEVQHETATRAAAPTERTVPTVGADNGHRSEVVKLAGSGLTLRDVRRVALGRARASLPDGRAARVRVERSVAEVRRMVDEGQAVYGVTTGFGGMAGVLLAPEQAEELQANLLHFHRAGVGEAMPEVDVRAAMAIRANGNMRGASGLRWAVIERMVTFLNEGVTPLVRRHGSIGASGDLTPLAAIAAALIGLDGVGRVSWRGREMPAREALEALELEPLSLGPKEALALINGTAMSAAVAVNCTAEIRALLGAALAFHALAVQALAASPEVFARFAHDHKPHPGQSAVAEAMRQLLDGSSLVVRHDPNRPRRDGGLVQDRYSVRCIAQFLGPAVEATSRAREQLEVEINSSSDNPLIDAEHGIAYHCGNFLAEHVATAVDSLRAQLGLVVKHVDAQLALLMAPEFSNGLPPSLVGNPEREVNMGLKAAQITANALMPLVVYHGAPIAHLFATHAEQFNQNVNSLSLPAGHLARTQIELARQHVAIALISAVQAADLRTRIATGHNDAREALSPASVPIYEAVRDALGRPASPDRPLVRDDNEQALDDYIERVAAALEGDGPLGRAVDALGERCVAT